MRSLLDEIVDNSQLIRVRGRRCHHGLVSLPSARCLVRLLMLTCIAYSIKAYVSREPLLVLSADVYVQTGLQDVP